MFWGRAVGSVGAVGAVDYRSHRAVGAVAWDFFNLFLSWRHGTLYSPLALEPGSHGSNGSNMWQ